MAQIDRVMVIKLGPPRDFVLAIPAMAQIRAAHPKARITLLTAPPYEAFAKASGLFDFVLVEMAPLTSAGAWLALAGRVRPGKPQRVYDLEASSGTNMLFQALRPFPPAWSGTAMGASLPHRNGRRRAAMHPLERRAEQLQHAGIWPDAPIEPGSAPEPDITFVLRSAAARGAAGGRPYVVLAPGGDPAIRWPAEAYARLAALFSAEGYDIVVAGRPEDAATARIIQHKVSRARDLTGRTDVLQLAILAAKADLVVGSDPDFMQIVAATDVGAITPLPTGIDPAAHTPRGRVTVVTGSSLTALSPEAVMQVAPALLPRRA